jgi:hypothetical protein
LLDHLFRVSEVRAIRAECGRRIAFYLYRL